MATREKLLSRVSATGRERLEVIVVRGQNIEILIKKIGFQVLSLLFSQEILNGPEGKHTFAVIAKVKKGVKKVYQVVRICSIGIKRYIKIKAVANLYAPEYASYFWQRRNRKDSKLLPALSAREFRAKFT